MGKEKAPLSLCGSTEAVEPHAVIVPVTGQVQGLFSAEECPGPGKARPSKLRWCWESPLRGHSHLLLRPGVLNLLTAMWLPQRSLNITRYACVRPNPKLFSQEAS